MQLIGEISIHRVVESEGAFAPLDFLLPGISDALLRDNAWLRPAFVDRENRVMMSFHSFLLRTPRHTILVDGCVGNGKERPLRPQWHRQEFDFLARLAAAGVAPEEIDFVFCTHLHADHVGWNTRLRDGQWVPTFPRARYLFARREYEHWERLHREAVARGDEVPNHGSFADSVLPVMEAGRAELVESDFELEDGIHLEPAYGHTPGTCVLHARSKGRHGIFTGDVIHTPVQLADPALSSRFCSDAELAARSRRALCERYADTASTLFTGHFPSPSAARLTRRGAAFGLLS